MTELRKVVEGNKMQPYSKDNMRRMVIWGIPIIATLALVALLLVRPIFAFVNHNGHEIGFAFCNPILWLLGLDNLMWEAPMWNVRPDRVTPGAAVAIFFSVVAHIVLAIFTVWGIVILWIRAGKKSIKIPKSTTPRTYFRIRSCEGCGQINPNSGNGVCDVCGFDFIAQNQD